MIDAVRSFASGFIFTTSMPPVVAAGSLASVRYVRAHHDLRVAHQERTGRLRDVLRGLGLPLLPSQSHIIPVLVGDPRSCKAASDLLLEDHGIYVQPINYPTVPTGTERLRLTATTAPHGRNDRRPGGCPGRSLGPAAPRAHRRSSGAPPPRAEASGARLCPVSPRASGRTPRAGRPGSDAAIHCRTVLVMNSGPWPERIDLDARPEGTAVLGSRRWTSDD